MNIIIILFFLTLNKNKKMKEYHTRALIFKIHFQKFNVTQTKVFFLCVSFKSM